MKRGQLFLDAQHSDVDSGRSLAFAPGLLVVLSVQDFLQKALPAAEEMLSPWLLTQSLNLIHSWRGVGKTHVALGIAYAVASGGQFLNWSAVKPRKVLYIDGEMPACALQERLADITVAAGLEPAPGMLPPHYPGPAARADAGPRHRRRPRGRQRDSRRH